MSEPVENLRHAAAHPPGGNPGPVDEDHRQPEGTRGVELGPRGLAARILGNNEVDTVLAHQREIVRQGERAARYQYLGVGQGQRGGRFVDKPQQIEVLRLVGKGGEILAADGEEYARGGLGQGGNRRSNIGDQGPRVAGGGDPRRAFQGAQRNARFAARSHGVGAHLRGKRMGCVDHVGDAGFAQIIDQARNAAEAADPCRQRLRARHPGPSSVGERRVGTGVGKRAGELGRLGGAAEKKDAGHG